MRLRCMLNLHSWGDDLYSVETFLRDWVVGARTRMEGELVLRFCNHCNAVEYDHVSMLAVESPQDVQP